MRNLVLASLLGASASAFVLPSVGGAIHYQVTQPHSLYGVLPAPASTGPVSVTLGSVPLTFVMTDVMVGFFYHERVTVTVNGNPVFTCGCGPTSTFANSEHLANGILIPAGSTIAVHSIAQGPVACPITLAGYVQ